MCQTGEVDSGDSPHESVRLVLIGFIVLLSTGLLAEEGMWMPQQIPALAARLRALGFTGDPKSFADLTGQPMGAIVSLGAARRRSSRPTA